jgi:hypothetical protein
MCQQIIPTSRTILRTLDGQIIVRPEAPDSVRLGKLTILLNEDGKIAWNEGKDIYFPQHMCGVFDNSRLDKAEF